MHEIAADLRCVVCQSLSVADSPVGDGEPDARDRPRAAGRGRFARSRCKAYFVEKYGAWILLAPPRQGFNLLVWVVPFVGLGRGPACWWSLPVRRWSRRRPPRRAAPVAAVP